MSDTPRTDALWLNQANSETAWYRVAEEMRNHSRELESELTTVTEEWDRLKEIYRIHYVEAERITNEMCRASSVCRELKQKLASATEERDDALRKLESLEESITSLDHPNIRILLRQAESYALDVAEKHEKRYCEIKKQLTDSNVHLENITIERNSERALADRLAADLNDLWHHYSQTEASYEVIDEALTAWKEARSE